jgi:hypothetical protein
MKGNKLEMTLEPGVEVFLKVVWLTLTLASAFLHFILGLERPGLAIHVFAFGAVLIVALSTKTHKVMWWCAALLSFAVSVLI